MRYIYTENRDIFTLKIKIYYREKDIYLSCKRCKYYMNRCNYYINRDILTLITQIIFSPKIWLPIKHIKCKAEHLPCNNHFEISCKKKPILF